MEDTSLFINLENIKTNLKIIKSTALARNKTIIAIIKSDAYGHGISGVAMTLNNEGINFFGVIRIEEALTVLKDLPRAKILLLSGTHEKHLKDAFDLNLSLTVFSLDYLNTVLEEAKKFKKRAIIQIKFDSGMNRLGFTGVEIKKAVEIIKNNKKWLAVEGFFSHLSSAGNDLEYTNFQLENFRETLGILGKNGINPKFTHISASPAIFNKNIKEDFSNAIRPGISIYGMNPNNGNAPGGLKPLMELKSSVIQVKRLKKGNHVSYNNTFTAEKDMKTAVINAGYDNGIPRLLSNKGRVLIKGKYAKILGIVTMNMTVVDISGIKGVVPGDEAVIIGNSGKKEISVKEVAGLSDTIPYEICLNVGKSNPRTYIK